MAQILNEGLMMKMAEDGKRQAQLHLVSYIKNIYDMLNDLDMCFVSGAFVIDDMEKKLQFLLSQARDYTLPRMLESHARFNPSRNDICKGVCEIHLQCGDLTLTCQSSGVKREVRLIKFYPFSGKRTADGNRFVYLKCESSLSTWSWKHMQSAINRYLLGRSKTDDKHGTRREDCKAKKCTCNDNCDAYYPGDPVSILHEDGSEIPMKRAYTSKDIRGKDEFWVPHGVHKYLLKEALRKRGVKWRIGTQHALFHAERRGAMS